MLPGYRSVYLRSSACSAKSLTTTCLLYHTLNTLARFAGFEDWNAFKRQGGDQRGARNQPDQQQNRRQRHRWPSCRQPEATNNGFRSRDSPEKKIPLVATPDADLLQRWPISSSTLRKYRASGPVNPSLLFILLQ